MTRLSIAQKWSSLRPHGVRKMQHPSHAGQEANMALVSVYKCSWFSSFALCKVLKICVCEHTHAHARVFMHASVLAQLGMCGGWHRISTLVFKTGYLTESGACCLGWTDWSLREPQGSACLSLPVLGKHVTMLGFLHRCRESKLKLFPHQDNSSPCTLQCLIRTANLLCFQVLFCINFHNNSVWCGYWCSPFYQGGKWCREK